MFSGSIPALITPFRDGIIDERAFKALVEAQISAGSSALVPCGTTGESPTLSHEEHKRVIALCVETAAGRVPVIAGAGSNATDEAIDLTRFAKQAGADAVLSVAPYYNRPSQQGLIAHFTAIAEAVDIPIVLYNVPGRTVVNIDVLTMARLARIPNIIGVKDATGDLTRVARQTKACGENFVQLSGNDDTALGFNAHGGVGCISVTANVAPRACAEMQACCAANDFVAAREIDQSLASLHRAMFVEPSPAAAKYACSLLGICTEEVRLPILPLSDEAKVVVRAAMVHAGVINE